MLAAAGVVMLWLFWGALIAVVGYVCIQAVRVLPLVGRRGSIPGARKARDRVVFRNSEQ
jgi:hypothetical protein